jgi:2-polyprenyl-6-methoxyphenol hydroxylase-like FAD-dependent oxidoreductase
MSRQATIAGAGISGLATARALLADGWDVRLFEQSPGLPEAGTALGMWPEAMKALDRLGLRDLVQAKAVRQREARFLRPDGSMVARIAPEEPVYLISRPALLSNAVSGKTGRPHQMVIQRP